MIGKEGQKMRSRKVEKKKKGKEKGTAPKLTTKAKQDRDHDGVAYFVASF